MTEEEAVGFQQRASEIAAELEALAGKLQDLHDGIPVSPREDVMLLGEEDLDVATALRSTSDCVLADHPKPAITELRKWAAYEPPRIET